MELRKVRWSKVRLLWAGVFVVVLLGLTRAGPASGRIEEVLFWDDGGAEDFMSYSTHGLVVWFQAPEWARSVVSVRVYLGSSGDPAPFEVSILGVEAGDPPQPGYVAGVVSSGGSYPENAWLELEFAPLVSIEDEVDFPDRKFYAKVRWFELGSPAVGWDTDVPHHDSTLVNFEGTWVPLNGVDGMIRAVVSDEQTPVDASSWGRVKALYDGR